MFCSLCNSDGFGKWVNQSERLATIKYHSEELTGYTAMRYPSNHHRGYTASWKKISLPRKFEPSLRKPRGPESPTLTEMWSVTSKIDLRGTSKYYPLITNTRQDMTKLLHKLITVGMESTSRRAVLDESAIELPLLDMTGSAQVVNNEDIFDHNNVVVKKLREEAENCRNVAAKKKLCGAYQFFKGKLEYLKERTNNYEDVLLELDTLIREGLRFTCYIQSETVNVTDTFMGINDRGKSLNALENTKSMLIGFADKLPSDDKEYDIIPQVENVWNFIYDSLGEAGLFGDHHEDNYLSCVWKAMYTGSVANQKNLFSSIHKAFDNALQLLIKNKFSGGFNQQNSQQEDKRMPPIDAEESDNEKDQKRSPKRRCLEQAIVMISASVTSDSDDNIEDEDDDDEDVDDDELMNEKQNDSSEEETSSDDDIRIFETRSLLKPVLKRRVKLVSETSKFDNRAFGDYILAFVNYLRHTIPIYCWLKGDTEVHDRTVLLFGKEHAVKMEYMLASIRICPFFDKAISLIMATHFHCIYYQHNEYKYRDEQYAKDFYRFLKLLKYHLLFWCISLETDVGHLDNYANMMYLARKNTGQSVNFEWLYRIIIEKRLELHPDKLRSFVQQNYSKLATRKATSQAMKLVILEYTVMNQLENVEVGDRDKKQLQLFQQYVGKINKLGFHSGKSKTHPNYFSLGNRYITGAGVPKTSLEKREQEIRDDLSKQYKSLIEYEDLPSVKNTAKSTTTPNDHRSRCPSNIKSE